MNAPLWISQIDHCSVLITNLARSRQFYGELLGLREIHKPRTFDFEVLWYDLGDQTLHLLLRTNRTRSVRGTLPCVGGRWGGPLSQGMSESFSVSR